MVIYVLRRRHRVLKIVLAVLIFSAFGQIVGHWGGRRPVTDGPDNALVTMLAPRHATMGSVTAVTSPGVPTTVTPKASSTPARSTADGRVQQSVRTAAPIADLTDVTDPKVFAGRLATVLLSYGPGTDFTARNAQVLAVAAAPPLGNPDELAADLARYTPAASALAAQRKRQMTVAFTVDSVLVSQWAATQIAELGLPEGSYGIDLTGQQMITTPGSAPTQVRVELGVTLACPPATAACGVDRVYGQLLAQEFGP